MTNWFQLIFWGTLFLIIVDLLLFYLFKQYNSLKGKLRIIWGEILRDLGIGVAAGAIFAYKPTQVAFYGVIIMATILLLFGISMKENIPLLKKSFNTTVFIKYKMKVKRILMFLALLLVLLAIYLSATNYMETNALYPSRMTEWFHSAISYYTDNQSCITISPIFVSYFNDVSRLKGEISTPNILHYSFYVSKSCPIKEARIMIRATNLTFPIFTGNNLILKINITDDTDFNVDLNDNNTWNTQLNLYLPINSEFFNYYRFIGWNGITFEVLDFDFRKDIFKGYLAEDNSFSMSESNIKKEYSVLSGGHKRYEFKDTSNILLRFNPRSKPVFLIQKILDSIILGAIAVLIYDFFKEFKNKKN